MSGISRTALRSCTLILTILAAAPIVRATNGTPSWTQSQIAAIDPGYVGSWPDIAFDHFGSVSLSWSMVSPVSATNSVRHSQLTPLGLWNNREVASGAGFGVRTALAFDRAERPTIAWVNDNGSVVGQFNYGTNQTIAAGGAAGVRPVLSLDQDLTGSLRGMFANLTTGNLSSIGYTNGNFTSAALTTLPGVSVLLDAKMIVDDRGLRQIAARAALSAGGQGVVLASEAPGGFWTAATFANADFVDGVDIGLDPSDGRVAIAYTSSTAGTSRLQYSKFNGPTIATTTLLSSATDRFEDLSLAFDHSDNRPALAFERRTPSTQELWYSYLNGSSVWQFSAVDSSIVMDAPNNLQRGPTLAFDDFGTSWPAIAYVNAGVSGETINVAFDPPAGPEPATLGLLLFALAARRRTRRPG